VSAADKSESLSGRVNVGLAWNVVASEMAPPYSGAPLRLLPPPHPTIPSTVVITRARDNIFAMRRRARRARRARRVRRIRTARAQGPAVRTRKRARLGSSPCPSPSCRTPRNPYQTGFEEGDEAILSPGTAS
jgi:hypothetical protein